LIDQLIDQLIELFVVFTGWLFEWLLSGSGNGHCLVLVMVVWFWQQFSPACLPVCVC